MTDKISDTEKTERQFVKLIIQAFKNIRSNFHRDFSGILESQILFCEMDEKQVASLTDSNAEDIFPDMDASFQVMRDSVTVHYAPLYDALLKLNERMREIILMAYWFDMSDREIADETGLKRRTVNDIRNKAYKKLENIMEVNGYGAKDFFG